MHTVPIVNISNLWRRFINSVASLVDAYISGKCIFNHFLCVYACSNLETLVKENWFFFPTISRRYKVPSAWPLTWPSAGAFLLFIWFPHWIMGIDAAINILTSLVDFYSKIELFCILIYMLINSCKLSYFPFVLAMICWQNASRI